MPKLISVIIPYFDEPESVLQYAVHSVAMQRGVDKRAFEVLLVNDGNPQAAVTSAFCKRWPDLYVRSIQQDRNAGPGVARQTGIDAACGEYVMFIDADDRFYSPLVIGAFVQTIGQKHPDVIRSPWIEEILHFSPETRQDAYSYVEHPLDATWMFGKAYRKAYLTAAGIRMHSTLRVHEDTYFNRLVLEQTNNTAVIEQPNFHSYLWCWNPESTVRRNGGEYRYTSVIEHITGASEPLKILAEKRLPTAHCAADLVAYYYGCLQSSGHRARPAEETEAIEKHLAACIKPFWADVREVVKVLPELQYNSIYNNAREVIPTETFDQFVHRIGLE